MIDLEEIKNRMGIKDNWKSNEDYNGLSFHNDQIEQGRFDNLKLLKNIFPNFFDKIDYSDWRLYCWKGSLWWGDQDYKEPLKEFNGWGSAEVVKWLIENEPWELEK